MCGLTALFRLDGGHVDAAVLERMNAAIRHRGPDGDGLCTEGPVGLGHRRLAIVDVAGGVQPMASVAGDCLLVFNGEIYNFLAVRTRLEALGHSFHTRCDTEVILEAWRAWGPDCVTELDGMFAFVLWDRGERVLFAARDRLGKKPLYYASCRDGVAFGSEMAALTAVPSLSRAIDPTALEDFLAYGYVPEPATIYGAVRKLPAAHTLLLRVGEPLPAPRRYWRIDCTPCRIDETEAVRELQNRIDTATEARLMSDVPLGAFLSGGVDSAGVVAAAALARARRGEGALDTFTIGFEGAEDETPYARQVAAQYGTTQHEARVAPADVLAAASRQGRLFGEPFGDSSAVPTFELCRLARQHVTVALSGDGGDEVFAGYRRYRWHALAEAARATLPAALRRPLFGNLARLYPKLDRAPRWLRAKYTLTELSLDSALGYYRTVARVHDDMRRSLLSSPIRAAVDGHDPAARIAALMEEAGTEDTLAQAQYADIATWLPGDILTKIDRTSMANSLEARAPLLDYRLVEWGVRLPRALKLRHGTGKYVLKQALRPRIPASLLNRRKQGFTTSLTGTLRERAGQLRPRLLSGPMTDCGLFDPSAISRLIDQHESGAFDHAQPLWLLLIFQGFLGEAGQEHLGLAA